MERLIYFCGWDIADRADKKAVVITVELLAGKRCLHRRKVISAFPIFASRINFEGPIWLITLVLNGLMTHFASTLACGLKPMASIDSIVGITNSADWETDHCLGQPFGIFDRRLLGAAV